VPIAEKPAAREAVEREWERLLGLGVESAAGYAALPSLAAAPGVIRLVVGNIDFMADVWRSRSTRRANGGPSGGPAGSQNPRAGHRHGKFLTCSDATRHLPRVAVRHDSGTALPAQLPVCRRASLTRRARALALFSRHRRIRTPPDHPKR